MYVCKKARKLHVSRSNQFHIETDGNDGVKLQISVGLLRLMGDDMG